MFLVIEYKQKERVASGQIIVTKAVKIDGPHGHASHLTQEPSWAITHVPQLAKNNRFSETRASAHTWHTPDFECSLIILRGTFAQF